ncbi:hypothetical protein TOT_020000742 [Theileria orientalis strain Shintoku]|uniref:Uncharacterized protein n=1 Tax=Theileria orientalis strain Shintoku TaxID=869250 RepID=J4C3I2_THEOR|nr:hypothetical protein TOT_020000742 [Theileria orientalis strain Shintoku]BAM40486.1 hypothetical protein TOT_020000742 [Theileria orientalis strain Shintoku]|eukprot:XP_009690787.1 hypothetical protein TOT_020000742 [Theileria orientalis strain Shintoku]
MRLYDKLIYSIFICLMYGNDLQINGPLLVDSTWDWLKKFLCSGCCGCNSCDSDCGGCDSCGSSSSNSSPKTNDNADKTTDPNVKTTEVNIDKAMGTGYNSNQGGNYKLVFKPTGDYSIKAVKKGTTEIWKAEKKEDYSKEVISDFAKHIVTISIGSDGATKKVFKKGSDNKWTETSKDATQNGGSDGSGGGGTGTSPTSGGTTGTGNSTGTAASGGGGTKQSTPAAQ